MFVVYLEMSRLLASFSGLKDKMIIVNKEGKLGREWFCWALPVSPFVQSCGQRQAFIYCNMIKKGKARKNWVY